MSSVAEIEAPAGGEVWSDGELAAFAPPETLTPSEWAERRRILDREQSARSGPLRHANAPYLAGLMDLCDMPGVSVLWIQKAAQIGVSEAARSALGYWAECDPDPVLLVLPDEKKGREVVGDRIIPLFTKTPALRELATGVKRDVTLTELRLTNGFTLRLGWSNSPSSLATHPARRAIADEADKFAIFAGRESDPISLIKQRLKTYEHRSFLVLPSTPTTTEGVIYAGRVNAPIQLRYFAPCPHCGAWQVLRFDRLRWSKRRDAGTKGQRDEGAPESRADHAARIAVSGACWYECEACEEKITERQKPALVRAGLWAALKRNPHAGPDADPETAWLLEPAVDLDEWIAENRPAAGSRTADETSAATGRAGARAATVVSDGWPVGSEVGVQIPELYCLWAPWAETAAAFLLAQGDAAKLMDFANSRLGEPSRQKIAGAKADVFAAKCLADDAPPPLLLPDWCQRVLATVDVQKGYVYYVVRAWGFGLQSQRIDHGTIAVRENSTDDWRELWSFLFGSWWRFDEGSGFRVQGSAAAKTTAQRAPLQCDLVAIDAKYRTDEVLPQTLKDSRIRACAGHTGTREMSTLVWPKAHEYQDPRRKKRPIKCWLHILATNRLKDWLAASINSTIGKADPETGEVIDFPLWGLNSRNDADYNAQMAAWQKVLIKHREVWVPIREGAPDHYGDCEYMQRAVAAMAKVEQLGDETRAKTRRSWAARKVDRRRR